MAEKLLKLATPQDPIQELIKKRDTASQEELAASQKVTELETKRAQNEAERAATQAKAKEQATTELTARQTEREAPIKEEKSSIDKQLMNAHFEPSKENLESQVALFSLINVIGFAIGSGGKQNAQQAMSAMNGMLEGHQKGREDVFKQEKVKFDSNFKALQSKATFLENELRHSLEEFTRDKRASDERAAAAFAEAGADFMKTYAEKNGLVAAYERAKEVRKAADKAVTDEQTRQRRIEDKIDAEARAEAQRVIDDRRRLAEREEFARFAAGLKASGAGGTQKTTQQMFVVQRAVNALGGVASAVEALGQLPSGTTTGVLGNLQTRDGMFNFMRNAAGRTMSSSESKAVETLFIGITRNLAAIEASGAATGLVGLATQIEKLRPVAGDKAVDVALKMADIRRIATENIQPLIDSGLMPKQQAEVARKLTKRIEQAIPYTTQEVVEAAYGGKGKQTITQAGEAVIDKGRLNEAQQKRMRELEEKERAAK